MRFIVNPAGNRIVDASPEETHALRPCICAALRRHGCPEREIEDIAQNVEIVTWQCINQGRVMGYELDSPEDALLRFMFVVAKNTFMNYRQKRSTWREQLQDDPVDAALPSPVARLEARDLLRRIEKHPNVAKLLLTGLTEQPYQERHRDVGLTNPSYEARFTAARKWGRKVMASEHWREPPQPTPATPWHRKKKR